MKHTSHLHNSNLCWICVRVKKIASDILVFCIEILKCHQSAKHLCHNNHMNNGLHFLHFPSANFRLLSLSHVFVCWKISIPSPHKNYPANDEVNIFISFQFDCCLWFRSIQWQWDMSEYIGVSLCQGNFIIFRCFVLYYGLLLLLLFSCFVCMASIDNPFAHSQISLDDLYFINLLFRCSNIPQSLQFLTLAYNV